MATHQISVLGAGTAPDTDGDVFQQPYSRIDSGTVIDPLIFAFQDSGNKDGLRGSFIVPQNYVGTAKFIVLWVANATTGNCIWDLSYLTRSDDEDMGAAATDTTDTVTTGTSGTAFLLNTSSMTLTAGDFAAGDLVTFELFRDGANASDTFLKRR
jgi:hypothetical protein